MNAPDVAGTGYEFCGTVTEDDINAPREGLNDGILVELDAVALQTGSLPEAWSDVSVKNPIGSHNGSPNALLHVTLAPGTAIKEHSLSKAEAIYFVANGVGEADGGAGAQAIKPESFVFVPRGDTHAIRNTGQKPLELFVVLTGAGGLNAAL